MDISNLTLAEAEDKIGKDLNQKEVTILENGKEVGRFTLEQAGVQVDANKALESAYNSQDPTDWVGSFFNTMQVVPRPVSSGLAEERATRPDFL